MSPSAATTVENLDDIKEKKIGSEDETPEPLTQDYPLKDVEVDEANGGARKTANVFAIWASGAALISDGYQNSLMTTGNLMFKQIYGSKLYNSEVSTRVSNALLVGEVLGMVTVGAITDRVGRKAAILMTTMFIVCGGIMAICATGPFVAMFWVMTVARGMIGFGTGGEYPASSVSAVESANQIKRSGRGAAFIMVTNLVLTLGGFLSTFVFLIAISASGYKNTKVEKDLDRLKIVWRVEFAIGILLPLTVLYYRLKMMNSNLYQASAMKKRTPYMLFLKRYWKTLIGTCGTWFVFDFISFPNSIFSSTIISSVVPSATLKKTMEWNLLLGAIALPGIFLGAWLVNIIGRKWLLIAGFTGYLVIGLIIGCGYEQLSRITPLFIVFYGIMNAFGQMGPGNMEGLISAESYPTALRGSGYGISAALGKVGAAVGTQVFTPIRSAAGPRYTFIVSAILGASGIILAYFFVSDMTKEDLAQEDERWREYLVENGYDGELGDGSHGLKKADELEIKF